MIYIHNQNNSEIQQHLQIFGDLQKNGDKIGDLQNIGDLQFLISPKNKDYVELHRKCSAGGV